MGKSNSKPDNSFLEALPIDLHSLVWGYLLDTSVSIYDKLQGTKNSQPGKTLTHFFQYHFMVLDCRNLDLVKMIVYQRVPGTKFRTSYPIFASSAMPFTDMIQDVLRKKRFPPGIVYEFREMLQHMVTKGEIILPS